MRVFGWAKWLRFCGLVLLAHSLGGHGVSASVEALPSKLLISKLVPVQTALSRRVSGTNQTQEIDWKRPSKGTVIAFVSAKCPCSATHEPVLQKLNQEFSAKGFAFYAVHSNADEDAAMTQAHFGASTLGFPIIQDDRSKIANLFGALKTPHAYLVGRDGKIIFQGGVDDSANAAEAEIPYLRNALVAVANGKLPEQAVVRTLGCVIKR